jgi:RimJ/RimL family protein N-acetyltransferase
MAGDDDTRLGRVVAGWRQPRPPAREATDGRYVRIEPLSAVRHATDIHAAMAGHDEVWDYLPYGPFAEAAAYAQWCDGVEDAADPMFFAVCPLGPDGAHAAGVASYLRIAPAAGSIEIGHIALSPALQRGRAATEMQYLMMRRAFEAGYRRYEWKCNALNRASRRAAQRLGLSYEGVFRQAAVVKGRNRDTAWFAAIDSEWPALRAAFESWLDPANFDGAGRQRTSLSALTAPVLAARDPALA